MKRLIVTFLLLALSISLAAQQDLPAVLKEICERFEVHFIYDSSIHHLLKELPACKRQPKNLGEALDNAFAGSGINWQRRGKNIILKAGQSRQSRRRTFTVSGLITDAASSETLIGAGVIADHGGIPTGAVSNEFGFYSLTISPCRCSFIVSQLGYDRKLFEMDLQRDTTINFSLTANSQLDAATIVSRKDAGQKSVFAGSLEVPIRQIRNAPALFGESDVIKVLQMLLGIQGGQEGFSGLYVRGGGPEENLVLLDGVPMYHMDHLLGLFSIFQPEAVKDVSLYKGTFPARYGGRISSIVDIRTVDGNMKETHGTFTVGVLNDKFHIEGPIVRDRLSYSISARGLHTLLFEPLIAGALRISGQGVQHVNYYFYDIHGKLNWRISDRDRLFLGVYTGADDAGYKENQRFQTDGSMLERKNEFGLNWGSTIGSLRWNHVFSGSLFANATLSINRYRMDAGVMSMMEEGYSMSYGSGITDAMLRYDMDWTPMPEHLVKYGAEYIFHSFVPSSIVSIVYGKSVQENNTVYGNKKYNGHEMSLYAEDNMHPLDWLTINPGFHFSWFNTQGRSYWSFQPRLAAKAEIGNGFSLKGGYARMAQYVHLLSSTSIPMPLDVWVPITKEIEPVTSDQFSLGAYYDGFQGWEFSAEAYIKKMDKLLEYKEGVTFFASTDGWESQVEMGSGLARGLEFMIRKTTGNTTGWLAYTLAKSERLFDAVNAGKPFPYKYDRRHDISIVVNHKFSDKIDASASWVFVSGGWMTLPLRETKVMRPSSTNDSVTIKYVSGRNNYNLPSSHRLNLGINFRHMTKRGNQALWNLCLYNAYNAMNPNFVYYQFKTDKDTGEMTNEIRLTKVTILPILPAFSYTLSF